MYNKHVVFLVLRLMFEIKNNKYRVLNIVFNTSYYYYHKYYFWSSVGVLVRLKNVINYL